MRAAGTYFEQVPKTVIDKILARQAPLVENELSSDKAVNKRVANNVLIQKTSRNPKP